MLKKKDFRNKLNVETLSSDTPHVKTENSD